MSSDQSIEREIQAKGATVAPRITPADIEKNIASESYFTAADGLTGASIGKPGASLLPEYATYDGSPLSQLTFCVLVLCNGTKIVGINYGAIDPAQHSAERGRAEARSHAIEQVWPLLGYELRTKLANA